MLKISKPIIYFSLLTFLGLFISIFAYYIFPERFFFDSQTILERGGWTFKAGFIGSYQFSILFYRVTGLKYLPYPIIGAIQYSILCFILYRIGVPKDLHKLTIKNIILYILFLILALYASAPSKEFINFVYLSFIVFLVRKHNLSFRRMLFIVVGLVSFLGFFFRPYYFLVIVIALFMYMLGYVKIKNYKLATMFYGLTLLIGISLSYGFIKGEFISEKTRMKVAEFSEANTLIVPPIEVNTWYGETVSIIYGFFSVNLPINSFGNILRPQILIFVLWLFFLFIILIKKYDQCIKEGKRNNHELILFYILFSYFIVQGVFEPDLGSALRHKASVFPIVYYLLNYENFRKKA